MSMGFELRDLRLILAIDAEGSLAGAARRLDYSQPTASQHLAGLEARLRVRLVDRGPRGAILTEVGELLASHAKELLTRVDTAEGDVRRRVEHGVSTLRLGAFPSAGAEIAPRVMARLTADGVHVQMIEAEVPALIVALVRRRIHAALLFSSGAEIPDWAPDDLEVETLLEDEHLVTLPRGHHAVDRGVAELSELRDEQWIAALVDDDPSYAALVDACRMRGFEPSFSHRTDNCSTAQALVAAGLGVALIPRLALEPARADVVAVPLVGTRIVRVVHLAYLKSLGGKVKTQLLDAVMFESKRAQSTHPR